MEIIDKTSIYCISNIQSVRHSEYMDNLIEIDVYIPKRKLIDYDNIPEYCNPYETWKEFDPRIRNLITC